MRSPRIFPAAADDGRHSQDAVKRLAFACLVHARMPECRRWSKEDRSMKRSRRVVLTMMGSAAVGAVSMGLVPRKDCGPGRTPLPWPDGQPYCRATYGGFRSEERRVGKECRSRWS